jgi:hypothetical protein
MQGALIRAVIGSVVSTARGTQDLWMSQMTYSGATLNREYRGIMAIVLACARPNTHYR